MKRIHRKQAARLILSTNLAGLHELGKLLKTDITTIARWRWVYKSFPKPVAVLGMGAIYDADEVLDWRKRQAPITRQRPRITRHKKTA